MCNEVVKTKARGIVVAGSGQGECIVAKQVKGIQAGLYHGGSTKIVNAGRGHDNTNVLCFGSRFVTEKEARKAIKVFLNTKFEGGRHARRMKKVAKVLG